MTWFAIQSLVIIVLAFVLGLLVGWLIWGLRWRKVRFSESDALAAAGSEYDAALADRHAALQAKDDEIARLTALVPGDAAGTTQAHEAQLRSRDDEIAHLTGRLGEAESAVGDWQAGHAEKDELIAGQSAAIRDRDAAIAERDVLLSERDSLIAGKDAALTDLDALLSEHSAALIERDAEITRLSTLIAGPAAPTAAEPEELATARSTIAERDAEIARLTTLVSAAEARAGSHREEMAAQQAAIADKDAEIARLAGTGQAAETRAVPVDVDLAEAAPAADVTVGEPAPVVEEDAGTPDDLQRIEGIGPRIAAALNGSGIHTFKQLAESDESVLKAALGAAGLSFAPSLATWSRQARLLADSDEAGLRRFTDQMSADRDTRPAPPGTVLDVAAVEARAAAAAHDDLERVEGIGPRIGSALREAGIVSFRHLADAEVSTLQGALERAGLRFAPSLPTWSRQAALLADGDEAGFVAFTEKLVAGRDVSGNAS